LISGFYTITGSAACPSPNHNVRLQGTLFRIKKTRTGGKLETRGPKIIGVAAIFLAAVAKIALKLGVVGGLTTATVLDSKQAPWDTELRNSAHSGCVQGMSQSTLGESSINKVCGCLVGGTEAAHIIPTKVALGRSRESIIREFEDSIQVYMNSYAGQELQHRCLAENVSDSGSKRTVASESPPH
jgi:hypothetical protein